MKNKLRAFTLYETLITLSIFAICMVLVTTTILSISNITKKQQSRIDCLYEYQQASDIVGEFINAYSIANFSYIVSENIILATNQNDNYELNYEMLSNKLVSQMLNHDTGEVTTQEFTFKKIVKISFIAQNSIIKCSYDFDGFPSYVNLFNMG